VFVFNTFFQKENVSGLGQVGLLEEDKRLHISLESFCAYSGRKGWRHYATMHGRITEQRDLRGNGKELPKRMERNFL